MSDGRISQGDIVEASAYQEVADLTARMQELVAVFREAKTVASTLEVRVDGAAGIKDMMNVIRDASSAGKNVQGLKDQISSLSAELAKLTKVQNEATDAQKRNNDVKNQSNTSSNTSTSAIQSEAQALYNSVKARQESAKAYREEAATKKMAALQSADSAERTRLEADAKHLLANAINEEKAIKKELAAANKQVAATVKDNILAESLLTRELDKLNAASERQIAEANKQSNAYEILKREYNEAALATKTLAAEYVILQRSGNASVEQLNKMKLALDAQQKATLSQSTALLQMEQAVGQNQRAVGHYANATGEITQILREMPNFAISAQTGILSLSNNLPMLQASLSRLAQTIDVNTGKAIGWSGVLKTVASSIFSVQGLLILGTTLLVAFGSKMGELINTTTIAEQAQKNFREALKNTNKEIADEIGELIRAQAALSKVTSSRIQQIDAMNGMLKKYPELLSGLSIESSSLDLINERLSEQIDLLKKRAENAALGNAITKATEELAAAQGALNDKMGFFEKFWAARPWGTKPYEELNESAQKAIDKQYELYKIGVISKDQYNVMYRRLQDVSNAQDLLTESVENYLNPHQHDIDKTNELLESKAKLLDKIIEEKRRIGDLTGVRADQIKYLQEEIIKLGELRQGYIDLAEERRKQDTRPIAPAKMTFNEIDVLDAENRVKMAKKASKEELQAKKDLAYAKYRVALDSIKREEDLYKDDAKRTVYVLQQRAAAEADLIKALNDLEKPKKKKEKFDATDEILAARQRSFVAEQEIDKQTLEDTNAHLENIFNLETNSLEKRLNAYEFYVSNLEAIEDNENATRLKEKREQLEQIGVIEARIGEKIQEDNLRRVEDLKGVSNEERKLVIQKFALQDEIESATLTHNLKLDQIRQNAQKKEREIVESSTKYQITQLNNRFSAIRDQASEETALRLAKLNEQRELGELTEKEYWTARQRIAAGESKLLFDKQYEFLKAEYDRVINDPTVPDAIRAALTKLKGDLEKMRPEPRKAESKSILEYLGLTSRADIEADETIKRVNSLRISLDKAIEEYGNRQEYWSQEILRIKKEAAAKWGEGSDEYNKAIDAAAAQQSSSLGVAQQAIDLFSRDYEDAVTSAAENAAKVTESLKESIANSLKGLYDTLFRAIDEQRENYYNERFDFFDEEKKRIQQNAEAEKAAIQSSLLSQEEKERQLAAIDGRRIADEKKNDAQVKALKREQALREKKDAIFKIQMEGGVAAAKALTGAAENPVLAIAAAALIAAQTVANIALINSRPIPEYWKGTDNHPGGLAKIGERGMELGILPGGGMFLTPSKETIADLPKGTKIVSHDKLVNMVNKAAISDLAEVSGGATPERYAAAMAFNYEKGFTELGNVFRESIKEIPITQMYWDDGQLKRRIVKGNLSVKILNGHKGWR